MDLQKVKAATLIAGEKAVIHGSKGVQALGRGFKYIGNSLKGVAQTIANWVRTFFNNLPQYIKILKEHTTSGIGYIRENKKAVAVGSGIGVVAAALAFGLFKLIRNKEEEA